MKKNIKIAVVGTRGFPGVQGGVESHCQELYPRLAANGCQITVYARKDYVGSDSKNYKGVKIIPLWSPKKKSLEAIVHTFGALLQAFLHRNQYDIIQIHAIGPSLLTPIARGLGFKVVVTNHGPDYQRQKWGRFAKGILRLGESTGTKFASEVICVSRHIQSLLKENYGRNTFYIPNGVMASGKMPPGITLKRHGLTPKKYILAVGRLVPEKGFHDLLAAFREISSDWKLVIAGDADHEDNYSRFLKKRAAEDPRVVMTGFIKGQPLTEIFSNAGFFILPSYHEGLPIVLLEAMSYDLPILASNIPANLELVPDQEFTFPPGDRAALKSKLTQIMSSSPKKGLTFKNKQRLENEFNWDQIARETFKVYTKVLNDNHLKSRL